MRGRDRVSSFDVTCEWDGEARAVANLSLGGFFVASDNPLPVGQVVALHLLLPDRPLSVEGKVAWINEHAKRGARVWLHEVNGYSFRHYQQNRLLRPDLIPAQGPFDADVAAYQYHQEFREQEMNLWQAFGTQVPVTGLYLDETPQVVVYARPQ